MLQPCPACQTPISPNAAACPHCGEPLAAATSIRMWNYTPKSALEDVGTLLMLWAILYVTGHLTDSSLLGTGLGALLIVVVREAIRASDAEQKWKP